MRIVGDLGVPVAYGLPSGHVLSDNMTLPFGVEASLTVEPSFVELRIDAATVPAHSGRSSSGGSR
jgi:muramoyltetrapeptide carboxypeptidase LdcA involved in peptidoglycan recycling